jgi:ribose transport system permease protein
MTSQSLTTSPAPAGVARPDVGRAERVVRLVQRHGALAVLVLVLIIGSAAFPRFPTADNGRAILLTAAFPAIVALGMSFVILSGGIDLSVGSVFALGGVLAAYGARWGFLGSLLLPLAVCAAIGLVQGTLIARVGMAPFIVTLAGMLGARGLLLAISNEGGDTYLIPPSSAFARAGQGALWGIHYPVFIAVALFLIGMLVLHRTGFGQSVYAVGGSADAATLMGVRVARTRTSVYLLSALLAGFAGALNAAYLSSGVTILGMGMELDAIAAVVIGGTLLTGGSGSLVGTLAGILLLQVIQNLINQVGNLNSSYQQVVSGAFLALVVVAQTYLSRARRLA